MRAPRTTLSEVLAQLLAIVSVMIMARKGLIDTIPLKSASV